MGFFSHTYGVFFTYLWGFLHILMGFFSHGTLFLYFGIFTKKTRAEISRRMHRSMGRDLSYETDSGQKLKLFQTPISR